MGDANANRANGELQLNLNVPCNRRKSSVNLIKRFKRLRQIFKIQLSFVVYLLTSQELVLLTLFELQLWNVSTTAGSISCVLSTFIIIYVVSVFMVFMLKFNSKAARASRNKKFSITFSIIYNNFLRGKYFSLVINYYVLWMVKNLVNIAILIYTTDFLLQAVTIAVLETLYRVAYMVARPFKSDAHNRYALVLDILLLALFWDLVILHSLSGDYSHQEAYSVLFVVVVYLVVAWILLAHIFLLYRLVREKTQKKVNPNALSPEEQCLEEEDLSENEHQKRLKQLKQQRRQKKIQKLQEQEE